MNLENNKLKTFFVNNYSLTDDMIKEYITEFNFTKSKLIGNQNISLEKMVPKNIQKILNTQYKNTNKIIKYHLENQLGKSLKRAYDYFKKSSIPNYLDELFSLESTHNLNKLLIS